MTTFRLLVVDDEAPARAKAKRLLEHEARFTLVGVAEDGTQALERIEALRPDLVVLDVQMPGLTGFEVLDALGAEPGPAVIFSTAYDHFALRAFEAHAVDYLLKPYDGERFTRALDKAHAQLLGGRGEAERLQALLREVAIAAPRRALERLVVKSGEAWVPLRLEEVWRLSSEDKYVRVHTAGGEHLVRQSLRALEERLDPERFVRIHRGDIINLEAVARLEPWTHGDGILVLKNGTTVVLSRTWREAFLRRWGLEG
ncbi:LytTR family DNA-binding domain-containing protein [Myxococcus faecalis]|uniref:LytR/AlgR family response regulator transcription factor n=1 Tax=Myxococcus faecalis TaxID=3115646 RepID=UPI003CF572B4